jgi:hypothetical protein
MDLRFPGGFDINFRDIRPLDHPGILPEGIGDTRSNRPLAAGPQPQHDGRQE